MLILKHISTYLNISAWSIQRPQRNLIQSGHLFAAGYALICLVLIDAQLFRFSIQL